MIRLIALIRGDYLLRISIRVPNYRKSRYLFLFTYPIKIHFMYKIGCQGLQIHIAFINNKTLYEFWQNEGLGLSKDMTLVV